MENRPRRLLDQVRETLRRKHYSHRTEESYVHWIKLHLLFHNKRHPREMGSVAVYARSYHPQARALACGRHHFRAVCSGHHSYQEARIRGSAGCLSPIAWSEQGDADGFRSPFHSTKYPDPLAIQSAKWRRAAARIVRSCFARLPQAGYCCMVGHIQGLLAYQSPLSPVTRNSITLSGRWRMLRPS